MSDDLDRWLAPPLPEPEQPDRIWARTAAVQRHRRWFVAAKKLALASCCFALGGAAVWLFAPRLVPTERIVFVTPEPPAAPSVAEPPPLSRLQQLLAQGSDHAQRGDYTAALTSFKQALDLGGDDALAVSADDHWLLISLKTNRLQEKNRGRSDS